MTEDRRLTAINVQRFATRAEFEAALVARLAKAIAAPGAIMLAGGRTPEPAYRALGSRSPSRAAGLRVLFSDERYVADNSPANNYHQSRPLLDALELAPGDLLRVRTELPLEEAAQDYERQLAALLASGISFELGLLGLGADGHTAALFSAADLERAHGRLAIAVRRPDGMDAVSVTPGFLGHFTEPLFVVAGSGKQNALRALAAQDPGLVAWRAVSACRRAALWIYEDD